MTIDRGGLRYTIRIDDEFRVPLDAFKSGIRTARVELEALRGATRRFSAASSNVERSTKRTTRSFRSQNVELKRGVRNFDARRAALRRVNAETRKAAVSQAKAEIVTKRAFVNERRLLTVLEIRARAEAQLTSIINRRAIAEEKSRLAKARGVIIGKQEVAQKRKLTALEQQHLLATKRLARAQAIQSNVRLADLSAQAIALERINAVALQSRVTGILAARGLDPTGAPTAKESKAFRDRIRNMKQFGIASRTSGRQANRASFTFRRLFGILAAFAAARFIVSAFRNLVRETIRFNAAIEQSELGVATLITATSEVRDAYGGTVSAVEQLNLAQGEARRQVRLLRIDALRTVATFEQLLTAFQVAIAPGAQAGLNLDEIRKFTFDISNAAAAIGLEQNQLAEEIRSLLAGTIQTRTTRIAVSLGISNEDIRNAKEAGELFEFLQTRFQAFSVAAEKVQFTFNALFTNLIGGFQEVLLSGGVEFFEEVKRALTELRDVLITQDSITDAITPNPQAIAIVRAFTNGLKRALAVAIAIGKTLDFTTLLSAAIGVGQTIIALGQIVAGIVKGFLQGSRDLFNVFRAISAVITKFTGIKLIDDTGLAETAAFLTRILVFIVGIQIAAGIVSSIVGTIGVLWSLVLGVVALVNVALTTMSIIIAIIEAELVVPLLISLAVLAAIVAIVAALVGVVLGVKKIFSSITGIELKWITFLKLVKVGLPGAFKFAALKIRAIWITIIDSLKAVFVTLIGGALDKALAAVEGVLNVLANVSDAAANLAKNIAKARKDLNSIKSGAIGLLGDDIRDANAAAAEASDDLINNLAEVLVNAENDPTLGEAAQNLGLSLFDTLMEQFDKLGEELTKNLQDDVDVPEFDFNIPLAQARSLNDVLDDLPAIIKQSRKELSAQAEVMKELKEDLLEANEALFAGTQLLGLEGPVARQRQAAFDAEQRLRKNNVALTEQQNAALVKQLTIQNRIAANESRIRNLGVEAVALADKAVSISNDRRKALLAQAAAAAEVAFQQRAVQDAQATGGDEALQVALAQQEAAEAALDAATQRVEAEKAAADALFTGLDLTEDQQAAILQAIEARLTLSGQLIVANDTVNEIQEDQLRLAGRINEILTIRLTLLARQATAAARLEEIDLRAEQRQVRAETAAKEQFITTRRLTETRALVDAVQDEIERLRTRNLLEITNLDTLIAQQQSKLEAANQRALDLAGSQAGVEAARERDILELSIVAHEAERTALIQRNNAELEIQKLLLEEAELAQTRAVQAAKEPFTFGLTEGIRQFLLEAPDLFQQTVDLMKNSITNFADFISQAISDAFDPNKDVGLRQRFAQFLNNLANQIISMLIRVALTKALLGLGFLGGAQGGNIGSIGSFFGAAKGGKAGKLKPQKEGTYGFKHAHVVGLAKGGNIGDSTLSASSARRQAAALAKRFRPQGLHPSDTVPVWAAPDEWIIQAKSVRMYGDDVMSAINQGLVNPAALRAVSNVTSTAKGVTRRRGFQSGGRITEDAASSPVILDGSGGGPTFSPIIADDDLMQQLLNGGGNALMEWMKIHSDEINADTNKRVSA